MISKTKILSEAVRAQFAPRFNHLILHVTNICNFRCNHCFVEFEKKPIDLSLEEVKTIADQFKNLIWLDIGGGEPFLRSDLHQIVGMFDAEEISIPTNGWFTERILEQLKKIGEARGLERLILTISVDGLPDTHDEIRAKKGSFRKLEETFRQVRANFPELRIKINTVLNQRNKDEIIDLMNYVKENLNPDFHGILFLRGSPLNNTYALPDVEEIRRLEDRIYEVQQKYHYGRTGMLGKIQKNYQSIKREIANLIVEEKRQVIPCFGGQAHLVIYADGRVAPCELLPAAGSIRTSPLSEILSGPEFGGAVKKIKAGDCHCTHDCNFMENILFNFKLYPKLALGSKTK